jgi:hypothetical protein
MSFFSKFYELFLGFGLWFGLELPSLSGAL